MRKIKLGTRLMLTFLIISVMTVIVGAVGIISTVSLEKNYVSLNNDVIKPLSGLTTLYENIAQQRLYLLDMMAYSNQSMNDYVTDLQKLKSSEEEFDRVFPFLKVGSLTEEELEVAARIETLYYGEFKANKEALLEVVNSQASRDRLYALGAMTISGESLIKEFNQMYKLDESYTDGVISNNSERFKLLVILQLAVIIIGLILAVFFALSIARSILRPLRNISKIIEVVGTTGNLNNNDDVIARIKRDAENPDEIGQFGKHFHNMMVNLMAKVRILEVVAQGDLTRHVSLSGDDDTLGNTVNTVVDNLSEMVREVRAAADQIGVGAGQLTAGATTLAQSSAEQTATVERLNQAASDIADRAGENAKRSKDASVLAATISENAKDGRAQMGKMTKAMDDINNSSRSISSVMKAIDDIAFQTNILSLNAAVEAARAGQQGRGFAVVADEVRSLATRSASAAADSNDMIADTLKKSELGATIVKDTSGSLKKIVEGVEDSAAILNEIAEAAAGQNDAIDEVNHGIRQLTNVVVQNSATAEESAAASEEMRSQTELLISLVDRFVVNEAEPGPAPEPFAEIEPVEPVEPEPVEFAEPAPAPAPFAESEPEPAPVAEPKSALFAEPEPEPTPVAEPAPAVTPEFTVPYNAYSYPGAPFPSFDEDSKY
jgi:methyl-accepting chemotaxis protein